MTKLSDFNNELISCTLTQTEYKQLMTAVAMIVELSDAKKYPDIGLTLTECLKSAQKHYGIKFDNTLIADNALEADNLGSKLLDSYTVKRWEFVERANQELHQYAQENFHPDIYNLPEGETLQVADL